MFYLILWVVLLEKMKVIGMVLLLDLPLRLHYDWDDVKCPNAWLTGWCVIGFTTL